MSFECFKCGKEFNDIKYIFSHLKLNHYIKNDTEPMKCFVAGNICTEEFYCFNKLKSHVKNCKTVLLSNNEANFGTQFRQTVSENSFGSFDVSDHVSIQN